MYFPMPSQKAARKVRSSLLIATQTVVGCGIGLLVAGKMRRPAQKITAASLFSIGFLLAIPAAVNLAPRAWYAPSSERGVRRSLESIRSASGVVDEIDVM